MARIRNPASAYAANLRKRTRESVSPGPLPKRRQELNLDMDAPNLVSTFSRENSPSKNVHWGRGSRIISGPTGTDPQRRSQSPVRPALRRPLYEDDHGDYEEESEDESHGPGAQLQDDLCSVVVAQPPDGRSEHKKYDLKKKMTPGVGNVYVSPLAKTKTSKMKAKQSSVGNSEEDICEEIDGLKKQIWEFAKCFPSRPKKAKSDVLSQLIQPENEQLIRYVGCTAMGGGNGAEGWQELLTDDTSRKAVIWGVLGRALKENVFDELYFGAFPELEAKLRKMEREQARQDGFYRQRARSEEIAKQQATYSTAQNDNNLDKATARVMLGIEALLIPLWCLGASASKETWTHHQMPTSLFHIVKSAGQIARAMRSAHDIIYYWPPTLKDEEFEPARMECLNLNDMIRHSPYDRQEVNGRDRPILREGHAEQSQAIVRVVCFPGIQSFRQGGGALAKKELAAERRGGRMNDDAPPDVVAMRRKVTNRYGEEYKGNEGIRTRVISKGVVLLQWGEQRLLTKEAGTSVHIDAVKSGKMERYEKDVVGQVELLRLFEERMGSARTTPVLPQRSPGLIQRSLSYLRGEAEQEADEEESADEQRGLPVAKFSEAHREREAEKRGRVPVASGPRSKKLITR